MKYYVNPFKFENSLFDDFFKSTNSASMKTDIVETDNQYILKMELAGYSKENVKLSLDDGYLTVEASNSSEHNEENNKVVHRERFYGSQSRSFYVGNIDQSQISANFDNGILEITVPKEEMVEDKSNKYIDIK